MRTMGMAVLCLLVQAGGAAAQQKVKEVRAAQPDGAIRIHNVAGSITVTGWDRDSIAVEGTVGAGGEPLYIGVNGASAKLGVWAEDETDAAPAHLEVRVPARSRVWIKTATSDVVVRDVRGGVDVVSVSGRIELRGTPAEAYLESMGGAVTAEVDTRVLRARTAGGDITVRGRVADAQVYTVSGLITVMNKQVERGRFESVDGGIRFSGWIARGSTVEFVTHGGDIDAALPAQLDADIRISSFQGKVTNQLGGRMQTTGGKLKSREASLTLGGGGAEVIFRTFRGAVLLRRL